MTGLCVTNMQAIHIQKLYKDLLDYHKKPLQFKPVTVKCKTGQFEGSKYNPGQLGVNHMKRLVLSSFRMFYYLFLFIVAFSQPEHPPHHQPRVVWWRQSSFSCVVSMRSPRGR